jgi:hypothetical protein
MPYSAISLNRIAENGRGKQLLRVSFWRDSRADMHALRRLRTNVEDSLCYSKGHARYSSTGKNTGHSCAAQQSSIWDQSRLAAVQKELGVHGCLNVGSSR